VAISPQSEAIRLEIARQRTIANYSKKSLPEFVGDRSICHTFCRLLVNNHGWIAASAFGPFDPLVPRHIRTQVLAIGILWVLCCEAVLATFEVGRVARRSSFSLPRRGALVPLARRARVASTCLSPSDLQFARR
jgi:hypothetical protein